MIDSAALMFSSAVRRVMAIPEVLAVVAGSGRVRATS
jgi:hypothetical protein